MYFIAAGALLVLFSGVANAQYPLAPVAHQVFLDSNGDPLSSGTLETFSAGTSSPKATCSTVDCVTTNPTTITLNAAGRPSVSGSEVALYLNTGGYKFIVKNSAGTTQYTQDNIVGVSTAPTVLSKTASYTVTTSDGDDVLVKVDTTAGAATIGLYTSVGNSGKRVRVVKTDTTATAVTIDGNSTETIDAALTHLLQRQNDYVSIQSDGANWIIVGASRMVSRGCTPTGRLTLTTATPVTSTDVTAAGTIYYSPYKGNTLCVFGTAGWREFAFAELSLALTATSGNNYDVWVYDNSGTLTLETLIWTNDTTRATALTTQDGYYVKTGATTRFYLGTFRASGANTTEDSKAKRFVWNAYNRVTRPMAVIEATNTWGYSTATWRQANASTANQLDLVVGLAEQALEVSLRVTASGDANDTPGIAIGEDSTTTPLAGSAFTTVLVPATNARVFLTAKAVVQPAVGRHFYAWLEIGPVTNEVFIGDDGGTLVQSGIFATWAQ